MLLQASDIFLESTPYKDLKKDAPRQNAAHNSVRARTSRGAISVMVLKVTPCECYIFEEDSGQGPKFGPKKMVTGKMPHTILCARR